MKTGEIEAQSIKAIRKYRKISKQKQNPYGHHVIREGQRILGYSQNQVKVIGWGRLGS